METMKKMMATVLGWFTLLPSRTTRTKKKMETMKKMMATAKKKMKRMKKMTATATHSSYLSSSNHDRRRQYHIPEDLITDIQRRLPVSCFGRLRCVSKSWYSLLSNPNFIYRSLFYDLNSNHDDNTQILISFRGFQSHVYTCLSYDSLLPLNSEIPKNQEFPDFPKSMLGSEGGLICLLYHKHPVKYYVLVIGLFNPITNETKMLPTLPADSVINDGEHWLENTSFGFALLDHDDDDESYYRYKIVSICEYRCVNMRQVAPGRCRRFEDRPPFNKVHVFCSDHELLGWKELRPDLDPQLELEYEIHQYGCRTRKKKCYWLAMIRKKGALIYKIVSFDLRTEEFKVSETLPWEFRSLYIVKDETLVGFNYSNEVWVLQKKLDDSVQSWCKLFTIEKMRMRMSYLRLKPIGLSKHGKTICTDEKVSLQVLDPTAGQISILPFDVPVGFPTRLATYVPSDMSLSSGGRVILE